MNDTPIPSFQHRKDIESESVLSLHTQGLSVVSGGAECGAVDTLHFVKLPYRHAVIGHSLPSFFPGSSYARLLSISVFTLFPNRQFRFQSAFQKIIIHMLNDVCTVCERFNRRSTMVSTYWANHNGFHECQDDTRTLVLKKVPRTWEWLPLQRRSKSRRTNTHAHT